MSGTIILIGYPCGGDDGDMHLENVRLICGIIARRGDVPLAPQIYLREFLETATPERVGEVYRTLTSAVDEVWLFTEMAVTADVKGMIESACFHKKTLRFVDRGRLLSGKD